MENITTTSAHDLVEKIKKGEISSVEVCEAYLERIKKFEKDVKAWAFFDKKLLMEKAKEKAKFVKETLKVISCLLYTSPSPRDR